MDDDSQRIQDDQRVLLRFGAALVFLGLVSGFTTLFAKSPATALSAHNVGTIEGAMLIGLAGAWPAIRASLRTRKIIKYTALVGTYANWIGVQLAAFWSARRMFSVSGGNMPEGATVWQEVIVGILLNLSILVMVTTALIVVSTRRSR